MGLDAPSLRSGGPMAVYFFFVLSGYLLTKRVFDEIQSSRNEPPKRFVNLKIVNYRLRRFFRVYPALVTAAILLKLFYVTKEYSSLSS